MANLVVRGGRRLHGRVRIGGRKNSAVAVIPAALLANGPSVLENLPVIRDVDTYIAILRAMGVKVDRIGPHAIRIDPRHLEPIPPPDLVKEMRASYYLLGVFLGRYGYAEVPVPGGCDIGQRPLDQHLKGLRALGADVTIEHGVIRARADRLVGAPVYLDVVSVGATINIMLAAVLAEGTTVIENAAKEPHIVDVANLLNAMGARVVGAGTDVIKIRGVPRLKGASHAIIPDEIEAATFMMAAVATRGDVVVENVIPKHLDPITAKLREAGAEIEENGDWIRVTCSRRPTAVTVKTLPYPGFPTDAQQPMTALLSIAEGTSVVTDTIWEARFKHVDELQRMGTRIRVEGRTAIIDGVERLSGTHVRATDLRAGAALVVAGLVAEGETVIGGVEHIERGYELIHEKLGQLGADIQRVTEIPAPVAGRSQALARTQG
ncbi:MAG: UDP-N-acetylglucosamine 1-carboxyvinyltransferase [Thermaerobacter sp.]|nr:UDP-N-acetylglucosamine 1-carboxyvinyltransferase [Bacillota bacterium]REJ32936.1 MAG: UDP-N-acetylglucosamine 1-carboxyvinyltransferase [Bacillota bacterium]